MGRWQHFGNSILSVGNNFGRFAGNSGCVGGRGSSVIQRIGDFVESIAEQVTVDVHRHRGTGVAEHLLDDFDVRTACDRETRCGVAQLERMEFGDTDGFRGG